MFRASRDDIIAMYLTGQNLPSVENASFEVLWSYPRRAISCYMSDKYHDRRKYLPNPGRIRWGFARRTRFPNCREILLPEFLKSPNS